MSPGTPGPLLLLVLLLDEQLWLGGLVYPFSLFTHVTIFNLTTRPHLQIFKSPLLQFFNQRIGPSYRKPLALHLLISTSRNASRPNLHCALDSSKTHDASKHSSTNNPIGFTKHPQIYPTVFCVPAPFLEQLWPAQTSRFRVVPEEQELSIPPSPTSRLLYHSSCKPYTPVARRHGTGSPLRCVKLCCAMLRTDISTSCPYTARHRQHC